MSQPDLFRLPRSLGTLVESPAPGPLKPKHIWAIRQHLHLVPFSKGGKCGRKIVNATDVYGVVETGNFLSHSPPVERGS